MQKLYDERKVKFDKRFSDNLVLLKAAGVVDTLSCPSGYNSVPFFPDEYACFNQCSFNNEERHMFPEGGSGGKDWSCVDEGSVPYRMEAITKKDLQLYEKYILDSLNNPYYNSTKTIKQFVGSVARKILNDVSFLDSQRQQMYPGIIHGNFIRLANNYGGISIFGDKAKLTSMLQDGKAVSILVRQIIRDLVTEVVARGF